VTFDLLPTRTAGAAENMSVDFLLLQRYPQPTALRFRHYDWRAAAFTFGYSQKIAWVRSQLPPGETFDLCRRPTGGGIVDHREDWTYALVIPRGHPLEEVRATESYRAIHEAIAGALCAQGVDAQLKLSADESDDPASRPTAASAKEGVCFQRAEVYDVVLASSGAKIAGAAQKRNKHGLLFQGSISKPTAVRSGGAVDWEAFEIEFTTRLAAALRAEAQQTPWPEFNEDEVSGLTEQYSSSEWIEYR
jgi:lipoate-protein ligase A